jgi:hypothetical protein
MGLGGNGHNAEPFDVAALHLSQAAIDIREQEASLLRAIGLCLSGQHWRERLWAYRDGIHGGDIGIAI